MGRREVGRSGAPRLLDKRDGLFRRRQWVLRARDYWNVGNAASGAAWERLWGEGGSEKDASRRWVGMCGGTAMRGVADMACARADVLSANVTKFSTVGPTKVMFASAHACAAASHGHASA